MSPPNCLVVHCSKVLTSYHKARGLQPVGTASESLIPTGYVAHRCLALCQGLQLAPQHSRVLLWSAGLPLSDPHSGALQFPFLFWHSRLAWDLLWSPGWPGTHNDPPKCWAGRPASPCPAAVVPFLHSGWCRPCCCCEQRRQQKWHCFNPRHVPGQA